MPIGDKPVEPVDISSLPFIKPNAYMHQDAGRLHGRNYCKKMSQNLSRGAFLALREAYEHSPKSLEGLPVREADINLENIDNIVLRLKQVASIYGDPELETMANQLTSGADELDFCETQVDRQEIVGERLKKIIKDAYDKHDLAGITAQKDDPFYDLWKTEVTIEQTPKDYLATVLTADFTQLSREQIQKKVTAVWVLLEEAGLIDNFRDQFIEVNQALAMTKELEPTKRKELRIEELQRNIKLLIPHVVDQANKVDRQYTLWGLGPEQSLLERTLRRTSDRATLDDIYSDAKSKSITSLGTTLPENAPDFIKRANTIVRLVRKGMEGHDIPKNLEENLQTLAALANELNQVRKS